MQDKFPIIVDGEDGTHIGDLLLNFIGKFGSQLIDENKICFESFESFSFKTMAQSQEVLNQTDFCTSVRKNERSK